MRRDGKLWHLEDTVSKADAVVWGGGIIRVVKENKRKDEEEWIEVIEKHQQKYDK
jgi:tryptophan synthase alpha subunit